MNYLRYWQNKFTVGGLALTVLVAAVLLPLIQPAWCQEPSTPKVEESVNADGVPPSIGQFNNGVTPDTARFYSFLEPNTAMPPGFVGKYTQEHPELKRFMGGPRPMVQWYFWANQKRPFLPSAGFILFFSLISWALLPSLHERSAKLCREKFWSTFFIGVFVLFSFILLVRGAIGGLIGWPMGIVLIGMAELGLMCGVAVMASLFGQTLGYFLKIEKLPFLKDRPDAQRFAHLLIGSLILAALLQIPGFGVLPRVGTRLVGMLAVLGLGGLFRAKAFGAKRAEAVT